MDKDLMGNHSNNPNCVGYCVCMLIDLDKFLKCAVKSFKFFCFRSLNYSMFCNGHFAVHQQLHN